MRDPTESELDAAQIPGHGEEVQATATSADPGDSTSAPGPDRLPVGDTSDAAQSPREPGAGPAPQDQPPAQVAPAPAVGKPARQPPVHLPPDPQDRQVREELLAQFYATLRVMYLGARPATESTVSMHERIREGFAEEPSWAGAYEIEQLLAYVMTDEQVAAELPRRMAEARTLGLAHVGELDKQYNAAVGVLDTKEVGAEQRHSARNAMRVILQRLLNDLQWFYNQRIRRREAAKRLSVRVSALFLSAFLFFFGLLFVQYLSQPEGPPLPATGQGRGASPSQEGQ
jgi:hypothetical protein